MAHGTTTEIRACLERLRAGDARAREALIGRSLERLRHLARRQLGDFARVRRFADTDDVLQDAVLRLLRRLEAHTPDTPAEFFGVAARELRCALLDLVRHYYGPHGPGCREGNQLPADSADGAPPGADPPQQTLDPGRLALWTEFHAQVERLPADERAVFDLLWYYGLTRPEAAAALGISEATVKRRWLAARLRLRELLSFDLDGL